MKAVNAKKSSLQAPPWEDFRQVDHYNYVCFFSNGTSKIGVTKQPVVRLSAYCRQASRFNAKVCGFWVSEARTKCFALELERAVVNQWKSASLLGHKETFSGAAVKGHELVHSLRVGRSKGQCADRLARKAWSAFGKAAAATAGQRALVIVFKFPRVIEAMHA